MTRVSRLLLGVLTTIAIGVPSAAADTLQLSVSPGQPTDQSGVKVTASGSTGDPSGAVLSVHYRTAGTGGCAATPAADTGSGISPDGQSIGTGSFSVTSSGAASLPLSSYTLCSWLTDDTVTDPTTGNPKVWGPFTGTFSVTAADTISLTAPSAPVEGQPFEVDATGSVYDANAAIDATYKPAGGNCSAVPASDSGTVSASGTSPTTSGNGSYTAPAAMQLQLDAGAYQVCAWLVDSQSGTVLAQTSTNVTVGTFDAGLSLRVAAQVDPGEPLAVNVAATLPAGVPTNAVALLVPDRPGTTCAPNPDAEPSSAQRMLLAQLSDTQVPSGTVATDASASGGVPTAGAYLVCAWLTNGWTLAAGAPPTIAGPISAVVRALPPRIFRGRTSQRLGLSITELAVERVIVEIAFDDHVRCPRPAVLPSGLRWNGASGQDLRTDALGVEHVDRTGAVRVRLHGNPSHTFDLTGRVNGTRFTGYFVERGRVSAFTSNPAQRFTCSSGRVRFSIRF